MEHDVLLQMTDICKEFPGVKALDHVSLTVKRGTVHALMGENGAGKSTLMKCLFGMYAKNSGQIFLEGKEINFKNSKEALENGVAMVHQELNQALKRNVMDNLWLGRYPKIAGVMVNEKKIYDDTKAVFKELGIDVDPKRIMSTMPVSQRQMVEIAKAVSYNSKVIVFDEPTSSLTEQEVEHLFEIINMLRDRGCGIIYISHKMPELFEICDTYYVLRDGKLVAYGRFDGIDENGITEQMIGRQLADDDFSNHVCVANDQVAMSVKNLTGQGFTDISFDLHQGEILAITGLQGSGRDAVADALCGVIPYTGTVVVNGKTMRPGSISGFMRNQVAMVPRMRKERGIHNDLSIYDNLYMAYLNTKFKRLLIKKSDMGQRFGRQKEALAIKTENPKNPITSLSGGNQQKVILGKWLEADADILLFDNPTQGIDVGTKFEIYHLILKLAKAGKAVIVFSQEFPELYKVADKCLVLYKGRINATLGRDELTEKNVMYYSTGANLEVEKHA